MVFVPLTKNRIIELDNKEHVAIIKGDVEDKENVLVRVHSECLTGDIFGVANFQAIEQGLPSLAIIFLRQVILLVPGYIKIYRIL